MATCSGLLPGNAVAVHDIEESAIFGTTLGMSGQGSATRAGTACTCVPSTRCALPARSQRPSRTGTITDGIMHALVTHDMPFVLTGSIRDDGPLPEVITDALAAQDAMRAHAVQGDDGDPDRHRAARDRDGEHAPRVRHAGRTARARARDDLRRLGGVRREQAERTAARTRRSVSSPTRRTSCTSSDLCLEREIDQRGMASAAIRRRRRLADRAMTDESRDRFLAGIATQIPVPSGSPSAPVRRDPAGRGRERCRRGSPSSGTTEPSRSRRTDGAAS